MAAPKHFDSEVFWLYDTVAGDVTGKFGAPIDGFTGATSHNVASAAYPLGTKIPVYNTGVAAGVAGGATFVYGRLFFHGQTLAAKHLCVLDDAPLSWNFTSDVGTDLGPSISPVVIALSAMTDTYYGWFWCEGVCPEECVSGLGGAYATEDAVAIGPLTACDLSTASTTDGEIGFDILDADKEMVVGYALAVSA